MRRESKATASARHILVDTEEQCTDLKRQITEGASFEDVAREHSQCPSGQRGGALGSFGRGQMVKEFEDVVFTADIGVVEGPVQTQFGYHLIVVTERSD